VVHRAVEGASDSSHLSLGYRPRPGDPFGCGAAARSAGRPRQCNHAGAADFSGYTPIGAPIVGDTIAALGARAGVGLGALTSFIAAIAGHLALNRSPRPGRALAGTQIA
jgi:hypothetical protein